MVTVMTCGQWYERIKQMLQEAGCDSPAFDARCLLEDIGGIPRGHLPMWRNRALPAEQAESLQQAAAERAGGRPLQYILGNWEFLDLTLCVGEGVLIPRPDTELLCTVAAEQLQTMKTDKPHVIDLCAGSGCVGLGIARLFPAARVTAVELSEDAFPYLEKNIAAYPACAVSAVKADILRDAAAFPDHLEAIVSNPPYIPSRDLPHLMREVRHEPAMALDGGNGEGLLFYEAIALRWIPKLCPGGFCAVEVGIGQAQAVSRLWEKAGLQNVALYRDMAGIDRVVVGFSPCSL